MRDKNCIATMSRKFSFGQKLNLLNYKKGLNKRLRRMFAFKDTMCIMYAETGEQVMQTDNAEKVGEYIDLDGVAKV